MDLLKYALNTLYYLLVFNILDLISVLKIQTSYHEIICIATDFVS